MPVMDEFREEREALKQGTLKQKISYFIEYYKWHVIITVCVIGFIASMIYTSVTRKETAFYAALVNALAINSSEEHIQGFAEYAGIDQDVYDLMFDESIRIDFDSPTQETIASSQKLMTYVAAGEIDVVLSDSSIIDQYAYNDFFYDIRDILSPEQIERYEPYFFYMDMAVADAIHAAQEDPDYDYNNAPAHPDPADPGSMERPVPIGIYLDSAQTLDETYYFTGEPPAVLAVPATSEHLETVAKYIDYVHGVPSAE